YRGIATEGEGAGRGGIDLAVFGARRNRGGADGERLKAELIRKDDAGVVSSERNVDDLAIGGLLGSVLVVGVDESYRRGGPGANPSVGRSGDCNWGRKGDPEGQGGYQSERTVKLKHLLPSEWIGATLHLILVWRVQRCAVIVAGVATVTNPGLLSRLGERKRECMTMRF